MSTLKTGFIELGRKQADLFIDNNLVYMDCLCKFNSPRLILVHSYKCLVANKTLKPIELLPEAEKRELWLFTKETAAGRLELDKCIQLSQALYVLEYFLQ